MGSLNRLSATVAARKLAAREITAVSLLGDCLERISERESAVRAWTFLDTDAAMQRARALDAQPSTGLLHGIPIGVKDLFDTFDMPTSYGSPIYADHRPATDAACVALARAAGAIVVGKTVTTEFATFYPGPTRNPHNLEHTPGGSSSGSAAAVADWMVPLAFGSQTAGSIVRPAAFCGVVGYKPTFGMVIRVGVKMIADPLDTIGVLATVAVLEDAGRRLRASGANVREVTLPPPFGGLAEAQTAIMVSEVAKSLSHENLVRRKELSADMTKMIGAGLAVSPQQYDAARSLTRSCRARLPDIFNGLDVLVAPSAMGYAPSGIAATGDPLFNRIWTLLHVPVIHVPVARGSHALPVGVTVVGAVGADRATLRAAEWIHARRMDEEG